jgi:hypothetical protein
MAEANRTTALARLSALALAPLFLGRRALSLDWLQAENGPPAPQDNTLSRPAITPPEHAIKRRG